MSTRMLTIAPLAVTLFIATASSAIAQTASFHKRAARTGDATQRTMDSEMNMDAIVSMGGQVLQEMKNGQTQHRELKIEVLDSDKDGARSVSFVVTQETNTIKNAAGEQTDDGDRIGSVYIVSRDADTGALSVVKEDGKKVNEATHNVVSKEVNPSGGKDLFDPSAGIANAVPAEATIGEVIQVDKELARKIFDNASNVESMTLTLTKIQGEGEAQCGEFDVSMKFSIQDPNLGMKIAVDLGGTASVYTQTSWMHKMDLRGPLTISGGTEQVQLSGTGNMVMKASATYSHQ